MLFFFNLLVIIVLNLPHNLICDCLSNNNILQWISNTNPTQISVPIVCQPDRFGHRPARRPCSEHNSINGKTCKVSPPPFGKIQFSWRALPGENFQLRFSSWAVRIGRIAGKCLRVRTGFFPESGNFAVLNFPASPVWCDEIMWGKFKRRLPHQSIDWITATHRNKSSKRAEVSGLFGKVQLIQTEVI